MPGGPAGAENVAPPRAFLGPFPQLEQTLLNQIAAARQEAPLAPLRVLAPSPRLIHWLKERLMARLEGLVNIHFHTPTGFIRALVPEMAHPGYALGQSGRSLLASGVLREALEADSYFSSLKNHPRLPGSLLRVLTECERAGVTPAQLRKVARQDLSRQDAARGEATWPDAARKADEHLSGNRKLLDLAGFMERYLELRAAGGHVDHVVLEEHAALAIHESSRIRQDRAIFIYGFDAIFSSLRVLLEALLRAGPPVTFFIPAHGPAALRKLHGDLEQLLRRFGGRLEPLPDDPAIPETLRHLRTQVFAPPTEVKKHIPDPRALEVVSAPDPAAEIRAIIREILELRAAGTPFEQVAVVFRRGAAYASLVEELFDEYRIPYNSDLIVPLHTVPFVRTFRSLLELVHAELPRDAVLELLCSPYFRLDAYLGREAREADVFEWDFLTRDTGITYGTDDWEAGLWRLSRWTPRETHDETIEENPEVLERRQQASWLKTTIERLRTDLERFPQSGSASSYVQILEDLLDRLLDPFAGTLGALNQRDRLGLDRLRDILRELADLDRVAPTLSWTEFKGLLNETLNESSIPRSDGDLGGVQVLELAALAGMSFDTVFLGGMVSQMFPAREVPDLVLLGTERAALEREGARFEPRGTTDRDERRLLCLAIGAARRRLVLARHRFDSGGKEQLPSGYLREVRKAFFGAEVFDREFAGDRKNTREFRFEGSEVGDWARAWELGLVAQVRSARDIAEEQDAMGELAAWLACDSSLQRAFKAEYERWDTKKFSRFDGVLGRGWHSQTARRVLSASQLELVGTCPFKYLAARIWKLTPLGPTKGVRQVERQPKGSLYHRIVFELLERLRTAGGESAIISPDSMKETIKQAEALVDELLADFEREQPTGYRALWATERRQILRDIVGFVQLEATQQQSFVPHSLETSFGRSADNAARPLKMEIEGLGELEVSGRIDRIDVDPRGREARVIDYKTGRAYERSAVRNRLGQGRMVQPPLYVAAARSLVPEGCQISGFYYYFISERKGAFRLVGVSSEDLEALEAPVRNALRVLGNIILAGSFFPWPDKETCPYCDYHLICRRSPQARFKRKREEDALATEYVALRERSDQDPPK